MLIPPFVIARGQSLAHNAKELSGKLSGKGIQLNCVTKAVNSHPEILEILYRSGVRVFSDSRLPGCRKIKQWAHEKGRNDIKICLLRPPSFDEIDKAVNLVDRFYVSTVEAAELIARHSEAAGVKTSREIILMVESGDQREGFLEQELTAALNKCSTWNIKVVGIGTNVACLRGQRPTIEIINKIIELNARLLGDHAIASPGNSSALFLLRKNQLPDFNGELRIGEALFLGNDTVSYTRLPFLRDDAFELGAEVIESRKKRCDKIQTVVALGIMDIGRGRVFPVGIEAEEVNRSSDHLVLCTQEEFNPGDIIRFRMSYFALAQSFISPFVKKVIV